MSPKLKYHQNWNFTTTEVLSKLNWYQNWNVTKHYNDLQNQNRNSRDRHWTPWSCLGEYRILSKLTFALSLAGFSSVSTATSKLTFANSFSMVRPGGISTAGTFIFWLPSSSTSHLNKWGARQSKRFFSLSPFEWICFKKGFCSVDCSISMTYSVSCSPRTAVTRLGSFVTSSWGSMTQWAAVRTCSLDMESSTSLPHTIYLEIRLPPQKCLPSAVFSKLTWNNVNLYCSEDDHTCQGWLLRSLSSPPTILPAAVASSWSGWPQLQT